MALSSPALLLGLATEAGAQTSCAVTDVAITGVTPAPSDPAALSDDCTTLLGLMDTLRGTASLNWSNTLSMTSWDGITVTGSRVTALLLHSKQLTGTIPAALNSLTGLESLWLHTNQLSGSIPDLSALTGLRTLLLSDNELSGGIPDLSALTNVVSLQLDSNELSGNIPATLNSLTSLTTLSLNNNELSGGIPNLSALTSLTTLSLNNNELSGGIPNLSALTSLTTLSLNNNELSGSIDASVFPASLQRLILHTNQLSGSIPDLSALTSLTQLWLHTNQLSGSIPDLSALTSLQHLYLHGNRLSGSIPDLSALTSLTILYLHRNQLSGSIDASVFPASLQRLVLSINQFSGSLPDFSALTSLAWLLVSDNRLSGSIDASHFPPNLILLYLHRNQLSGSIPDLSALTSLRRLLLHQNQLSGPLPTWWSSLPDLQWLHLADNPLTGGIPSQLGSLTNLADLSLCGTNLDATATLPAALETRRTDDDLTVWSCLRIEDASAPEGSALSFMVEHSTYPVRGVAGATGGLTLSYETEDGTASSADYTGTAAGSVTIPANTDTDDSTSSTAISVPTTADTLADDGETLTVTLLPADPEAGWAPVFPLRRTATGTILADDGSLPGGRLDLSGGGPIGSTSAVDDHPGSQLLFLADTGIDARAYAHSDPLAPTASRSVSGWLGATEAAQRNFISVTNTADGQAVTLLVQYHNDQMEPVLWYLRVLRAGANVLVDPFHHEIPGTDQEDGSGPVNVREILFDEIPAVSFKDETGKDRPGFNSGRFLIAVTAVGARSEEDDRAPGDPPETANVLFPDFLAEGLHGADNIDAIGDLGFQTVAQFATDRQPQEYEKERTGRNVGPLTVHNVEPVAFNDLVGHHTAAEVSALTGGIAWGVNALVRPAVTAASGDGSDHRIGVAYAMLNGTNEARLSPRTHGGVESVNAATDEDNRADDSGDGSPVALDPTPTENNRVVNGGALVWSSLYGNDPMDQRVQFLSVADDYGEPGEYRLIGAKTLYRMRLFDPKGNELPDPVWTPPVFGPIVPPHLPGLYLLVDGIGVMPDASPMSCTGNPRVQGWSLSDLTDLVPTVRIGDGDFQGLDVGLDPNRNASPGWVVFQRTTMTCTEDYGDGDPASGLAIEIPDGVPTQDKRSFIGGTLVVEKETAHRTFVTAGQAVLRFLTPNSTFAASWWLTVK